MISLSSPTLALLLDECIDNLFFSRSSLSLLHNGVGQLLVISYFGTPDKTITAWPEHKNNLCTSWWISPVEGAASYMTSNQMWDFISKEGKIESWRHEAKLFHFIIFPLLDSGNVLPGWWVVIWSKVANDSWKQISTLPKRVNRTIDEQYLGSWVKNVITKVKNGAVWVVNLHERLKKTCFFLRQFVRDSIRKDPLIPSKIIIIHS